ncbi:MAG: hypothetical protein M3R04_01860 [bacterium]|nr:hypothetical protein [bacterium]
MRPSDDVKTTSGALPPGWPVSLRVYPDAAVVEGRSSSNNGMPLLMAIMESPDAPEKISEFYGRLMLEQNFSVVSSSQIAAETSTIYQKGSQSLAVKTIRGKDDPATRIELTLVGSAAEAQAEDPGETARSSNEPNQPGSRNDRKDTGFEHPHMPRYPGSRIEPITVNDNTRVFLRLRTTDPKEQVMGWYENFYSSHGFKSTGRMNLGPQLSSTFQNSEGQVTLNVGNASMGRVEGQAEETLIVLAFESRGT